MTGTVIGGRDGVTEVGGEGEALAFLALVEDGNTDREAAARVRLRPELLTEDVGAAVVEEGDVIVLGWGVVVGFLAARFRLNFMCFWPNA